MQKNNY